MKRLLLAVLLLLPGVASAQCAGGLITGCPAAVNIQPTDQMLLWQPGQNPHMRSMQVQQYPFTVSGNLTVGSLTATQTGTSVNMPLSPMETLTRASSGTPTSYNGPLLSISDTVNWGGDSLPLLLTNTSFATTINGDPITKIGPDGDYYAYQFYLTDNALLNPIGSNPNLSEDTAVSSFVTKGIPGTGIPAGGRLRGTWDWYSTYAGLNLPSSQEGTVVSTEQDVNLNGLDDGTNRVLFQVPVGIQTPLTSGGYAASYHSGITVGNSSSNLTARDFYGAGGNFSHAGINLFYMGDAAPTITSATPGASVRSVTVNNILPLESGGSSGGPDFPQTSTAAQIKTATASTTSSATVSVNNANYIAGYSFIYDLTHLSAIPDATRINSISGNTITMSAAASITSGDQIMVSPGRKSVTINGDAYIVSGITVAGAGTTAGTVYFTSAVTVADATIGALIYPNAHGIWLCPGSATTPWCDIAFNAAGSASLRSDGSSGELFTGPLTVPQMTFGTASGNPSILYNGSDLEIFAKPLQVDQGIYTPAGLTVGQNVYIGGTTTLVGAASASTITFGTAGPTLSYNGTDLEVAGKAIQADMGIYTPAGITAGTASYFSSTVNIGGRLYLTGSTTSASPISLEPGVAPTSPINGDIWTTSAGLYVQINGGTVGPLGTGGGGGGSSNNLVTVATSGSAQTTATAGGNISVYDITLTAANVTVTPTCSAASGVPCTEELILRQDATAGRQVLVPSNVVGVDGSVPTNSVLPGNVTIWWLTSNNSGTNWLTTLGPNPGGFTQSQGDARYDRTVNNVAPDGTGNITVAATTGFGNGIGDPDFQTLKGITYNTTMISPTTHNTLVAGQIYGVKVRVVPSTTLTSVNYPGSGTGAVTGLYFCLWDLTGAKLGCTPDESSSSPFGSGNQSFAFSSPITTGPTATSVLLTVQFATASTAPVWSGGPNTNSGLAFGQDGTQCYTIFNWITTTGLTTPPSTLAPLSSSSCQVGVAPATFVLMFALN